jgi:hypothetical protein
MRDQNRPSRGCCGVVAGELEARARALVDGLRGEGYWDRILGADMREIVRQVLEAAPPPPPSDLGTKLRERAERYGPMLGCFGVYTGQDADLDREAAALIDALEKERDAAVSRDNAWFWKDHATALSKLRDAAEADNLTKDGRIAELESQNANLLLQAQGWAMEARCQKSTVHKAYQAVTGATGEPGDWNGANPIVEALREAEALAQRRGKALEPFADVSGEGDDDYADDMPVTVTFGRCTHYALKLGDFREASRALHLPEVEG